jgi:hypothetical protein
MEPISKTKAISSIEKTPFKLKKIAKKESGAK